MTSRLTKAELRAIEEALVARLAGPIEGEEGDSEIKDYKSALRKIQERLHDRR